MYIMTALELHLSISLISTLVIPSQIFLRLLVDMEFGRCTVEIAVAVTVIPKCVIFAGLATKFVQPGPFSAPALALTAVLFKLALKMRKRQNPRGKLLKIFFEIWYNKIIKA